MPKSYSYRLYEYDEALSPYGTLETKPPTRAELSVTSFSDSSAKTFHTTISNSGVCLSGEEKLLSIILDESGSMTWNDQNNDRIAFLRKMLQAIDAASPGQTRVNLLGFGGTPVISEVFLTNTGFQDAYSDARDAVFADSVYDFAGTRVVRKTTGYPTHPNDGVIVVDGIYENVKDSNLTNDTTYYYKIYTYNKYGHFSNGVPATITTHSKVLPRGINSFTALPRILPGKTRTENSLLIYNFQEAQGDVLYDSSGNNNHISLPVDASNFWAGATVGNETGQFRIYKGGRFNGSFNLETVSSSADFCVTSSNSTTVNLWVYRYQTGLERTIFSVENDATYHFNVNITAAGLVRVEGPSGVPALDVYSISSVPVREWTMITVSFSDNGGQLVSDIYINGLLDNSGTTSYPTVIANTITKVGGSDYGNNFFGVISNVSYQSESLTVADASQLYVQESAIFFEDEIITTREKTDNNQREVLLQWSISDDYDYANGRIKVVRKYKEVPSNSEDGTLIIEDSAQTGDFAYIDSFDFICGGNYYYRLFTINETGNECHRNESRIAPVYIPTINNKPTVDPLEKPVGSITAGNKKLKLSWNTISDPNVAGVRIYYSEKDYPVINRDSQEPSQWNQLADPINTGYFIEDTTETKFVHRVITKSRIEDEDSETVEVPLTNGKNYFYTLISYDIYGNISEPTHLQATPLESLDNIIFPSDEVSDVWPELVNRTSVSLHWKNPMSKLDYIELWFNQLGHIYAKITDLYGQSVSNIPGFSFNIEQSFTRKNDIENPPEREYVLQTGYQSDGSIRGFIANIADARILNNTDEYRFILKPIYQIKGPDNRTPIFTYTLPELTVVMKNPLSIESRNLLNKKVPAIGDLLGATVNQAETNNGRPCEQRFCGEKTNKLPETTDGSYIYATSPYICRIIVSYQNGPVSENTPIRIKLYKKDTTIPAEQVSLTQSIFYTKTEELDVLGSNGIPTGAKETISYLDIPLASPVYPEWIDVYTEFTFNGLTATNRHSILFASTLKFDLQLNLPSANGIEVAEQVANLYYIDPDDPDNISKRRPVTDGTLVKWGIVGGEFAKTRPFYSLEPSIIDRSSGVYSKTTNGVARNVWFGPVSNLENHILTYQCDDAPDSCCISEEYKITAQVIINNEAINVAKWMGYSCETAGKSQTFSRILMSASTDNESDGCHYFAWADGDDLIHLQIASDPATSEISYSSCFRSCMASSGSPLIPLPCGQIVSINPGGLDEQLVNQKRYAESGIEVLWNVTFDEDPYTGERVVDEYEILTPTVSATTKTAHIAHVPVNTEVTDIYLRLNRFIGRNNNPKRCKEAEKTTLGSILSDISGKGRSCEKAPPCSTAPGCPDNFWTYTNVQAIYANSKLVFNNKVVNLTGGGKYDEGIPPIYVGFREPLDIRFVDVRINGINGQKASDIVVDGVTRHTFVVEVTFAGEPVPNGTPVTLTVEENGQNGKSEIVVLSSSTVYTQLVHDPIFDPREQSDARSLAYFEIDPLPKTTFNARIKATSTYDRRKDAKRELSDTIELYYTESDTTGEPEENPVPTENPQVRKQQVYTNEVLVYDIEQDNYFEQPAFKESRSGHFSAVVGVANDTLTNPTDTSGELPLSLVLIGGFSNSRFLSSIEYYDIGQEFSRLSSSVMPTPRAFGQTAVIGNIAYCIGGLEYDSIKKTTFVSRKIEAFDTNSETWITLADMPENNGVAFGVALTIENNIYVLCGCTNIVENCVPSSLNAYVLKYDLSADEWTTISVAESSLYSRIAPFGFVRNNNIYIVGGSTPKNSNLLTNELQSYLDYRLSQYQSQLYSSAYFKNLDAFDVASLIEAERTRILEEEINTSPYHYPATGFIYNPSSDGISEIDQQWDDLPFARDRGVAVPYNNSVFFLGGANGSSTTLNKNEEINLSAGRLSNRQNLPRGRALFAANLIGNFIYITGGLTSGHTEGWVSINVSASPDTVAANGTESSSILIALRNDAGDLIEKQVKVLIKGFLKIPGISERLAAATAENTYKRLYDQAQGKISNLQLYTRNVLDPSSDAFQYGTKRKIDDQLELLPVLFTRQEFYVTGAGITTLLPRSEDPLNTIQNLAKELSTSTANFRTEVGASGGTLAEQVSALDKIINELPTSIDMKSNSTRDLYSIELQVTVIDDEYFGQTVCQSDFQTAEAITAKINDIIQKSTESNGTTVTNVANVSDQNLIDTTPTELTITDASNSGQASGSRCLFGIKPVSRRQKSCGLIKFYNTADWLPQIKEYLTNNSANPDDVIEYLDEIDDTTPFGSSQLYDVLQKTASIMTDDNLKDLDKNIYIASDNAESLSAVTLAAATEDVNSIDGKEEVPVVYSIVATSSPVTVSSRLARNQTGDAGYLAENTGGHTSVLVSSSFVNDMVNYVLSVSGALGYGVYSRIVDFGFQTTITSMTPNFSLHTNTSGYIRFRYSDDQRNWSTWSEQYEANNPVQLSNLQARYVEFEITLKSGFIEDFEDPYMSVTGTPCLTEVVWEYSVPREDYLYLNKEETIANAQQVEAVLTGTMPSGTTVEYGVATSDASDWNEFQTNQRPALSESKRTVLLDRDGSTLSEDSVLDKEELTTKDGIVFSSKYGSWSESYTLIVYERDADGNETPLSSDSYKVIADKGLVVTNQKWPLNKKFYLSIINENITKVGYKLTNNNFEDTISIEGSGYLFTTNLLRPAAISQTPPRATQVQVLPVNPVATSTFSVSYKYVDLNRNEESGTLVRWFKNGNPLLEINDKTSWTNDDLLISNKIIPDDLITVSITPSDGIDYGPTTTSPPVKISASPPSATTVKLVPTRNNNVNSRYDSGSVITINYNFETNEEERAKEEGTTIEWYVNGLLYKRTTYTTGDDEYLKKSLFPYQYKQTDSQGNPVKDQNGNDIILADDRIVYTLGNQVYAEITPKTSNISGEKTKTDTVTIENAIPIAKSVNITPLNPTIKSTLQAEVTIDDPDFELNGQTNQSEIHWYYSTDGTNFVEDSGLLNQYFVSPSVLASVGSGVSWRCRIIPYDGTNFGIDIMSSSTLIF